VIEAGGEQDAQADHGHGGDLDSIPIFRDAYAVDDATAQRARGWALLFALMLLDIARAGELGLPGGKITWGPGARAALERLTT
jgi:hypothetical protein